MLNHNPLGYLPHPREHTVPKEDRLPARFPSPRQNRPFSSGGATSFLGNSSRQRSGCHFSDSVGGGKRAHYTRPTQKLQLTKEKQYKVLVSKELCLAPAVIKRTDRMGGLRGNRLEDRGTPVFRGFSSHLHFSPKPGSQKFVPKGTYTGRQRGNHRWDGQVSRSWFAPGGFPPSARFSGPELGGGLQ
jgi:hypothetical protein